MKAHRSVAVGATAILACALFAWPAQAARAEGVHVVPSGGDPALGIFPNDRYTVFDASQLSLRRVQLPKPDCAARPSDCKDIDVINTLDGFSVQPRVTIAFSGDIDPSTVSSQSIRLVNLGDTQTLHGFGDTTGINKIVWDPASKTLSFEPDDALAQHSRYLLLVTNAVHDAQGRPIVAAAGDADLAEAGRVDSRAHAPHVVAASLFTTQSISADLQKVMLSLKQAQPAPIDFNVGTAAGSPLRALFAVDDLSGIVFSRQTRTAPTFTSSAVPLAALSLAPGAVGRVAYGRFSSPDYEAADKSMPTTPTRTGQPQPQGTNTLMVEIFLPSGTTPAGGWPVVIFGHGLGDSMHGIPWVLAGTLASQGLAVIAINAVGHGGGPLGSLTITPRTGPVVTVSAGGRGVDLNGDGNIDAFEGSEAAPPRDIIGARDGTRQTVIDLMQLVRQIQTGIDVDGDGTRDLNPARMYYAGHSFGAIYGTVFLGVERDVRAGVPLMPGGDVPEIQRLGLARPLLGIALASRVPSLINLADPSGIAFNENIPLRNQPPLINNVPGAMAIDQVLDRMHWVQQAGNPVSYAAFIRREPLPGNAPKPVIIQFAKGDPLVPNPTATALLRAGDLAGQATYFRNDLAFAADPTVPKNPHNFISNIGAPGTVGYALAGQRQVATFLASDGAVVIDPDGPLPIFETPVVPPLPETLNFIP